MELMELVLLNISGLSRWTVGKEVCAHPPEKLCSHVVCAGSGPPGLSWIRDQED